MLQILALVLLWAVAFLLVTAVVLISFIVQLVPALNSAARGVREGALRSVGGALLFQILSFVPFVALLTMTWLVQSTARRFGASQEMAISIASPIGISALLLPLLATLAGAYLGFRAGWVTEMGGDAPTVLLADPLGKRLQWLGPLSPHRW